MIDKHTGSFHSPFLIFIKGLNHLPDIEILQLLELQNVETRDFEKETECYLRITRDKEWVHIMDNWFYGLWHSKSFKNRVDKLGEKYDIFYCSVGDCDNSFDFTYYKNGLIQRKYVVSDDGKMIESKGKPLPFEEDNLKESDELDKVISIAKSIGIETNHKLEDIACYQYENIFIED
ncbi:hypothetical protein WAF17_01965 [Bernardetia sp. ABR2-2B]|uniref:hypothetical protein n=1 Tax=Bernardetia sp. ABR2-2B TaxID=3127472 RepID=UPI0030CA9C75